MPNLSLPATLVLSAATGGLSAFFVASSIAPESPLADRGDAVAPAGPVESEPREAMNADLTSNSDSKWKVQAQLLSSERDELIARLEQLEGRIDRLAVSQSDDARMPIVAGANPAEIAQQAQAALESEKARMLVLDIVEADREQRLEERRIEREEQRKTEIEQRATRLAEKLGLSAYDRDQLSEVLSLEASKRSEIFDALREDGGPMDRETMRESMRAIRDWKDTELESRFGADIASQIDEADDRGGRGRGRGGNRGGDTGGGGGGRGGGRGSF